MKNLIGAITILAVMATSASAGGRHDDNGGTIAALLGLAIVGAIIADKNDRSHRHVPQHTHGHVRRQEINPYVVCSSQTYYDHHVVIVRNYNCFGELINVERHPRY